MTDSAQSLHERAQTALRQRLDLSIQEFSAVSPAAAQQMLHELQVHQIELELQNEELHRLQSKLDTSQARYFDLYDLAPVGYCIVSESGLILQANLTAASLLGVARDALQGQSLQRFILPGDQDAFYFLCQRVIGAHEPQDCELRVVNKSGGQVWLLVQAALAIDETGAQHLRIVLSDVTARKMADTALYEKRESYRNLVDNTSDLITRVDAQGRFTFVNDSARTILGLEPQECIGLLAFEFVHPQDRQTTQEAFRQWVESPRRARSFAFENRLVSSGDAVSVMHWNIMARYSPTGEVCGFDSVGHDITDSKRVETELRESEQRYRTLVEWTPEPIIVHARGTTLYANPAAVKMFGATSASDLVAKPVLDLIHPDIHQSFLAHMKSSSGNWFGSGVSEQKLMKLDGTVMYVEVQGMAISYAGKPAVQVALHDVTDRKQAEAKAKKSEERLQMALRGSGDGHWDWDLENNVIYYSPRWWEMIGYGVDELPSDADLWRRLVHPDDLFRTDQIFPDPLESAAQDYQVEFRLRHKDGHYVPVLSRGFIVRDTSGKPVRIAGTNSDWTERKAIEASLKDSEQRYRTLVEWMPEPIVVYRGKSMLYVNPAAVQMFGARSASELIGTNVLDRVHPDSRAAAVSGMREFADQGLNPPMMVHKLLRMNGTVLDAEVKGTAITFDGGAARQASARDITKRLAIEAALDVERLKAENASQAKSRFLASASHDLRQPTHALGMLVARLAELPHDAQVRKLVENMDASVRALQDMLDGLFDIARLDTEQTQISRVAFPIEGIFGQLRNSLSGTASDKGLRLRFRPSRAWIDSDPVLIHRILHNLVNNAVKYTQTGSILVACRPSHDATQLRIEVRDSGTGIPAEHHENIFQEFFQVNNPARDRSKGLGVGLSIVKRACGLLGHPLSLRSAPDRGSCFSLLVPATSQRPDGTYEVQAQLGAQRSFDGLPVLLIEDDELGASALASLLASWGCAVMVAEGLEHARNQYNPDQAPELIISDYRLGGGVNGIEAVLMLRRIAQRKIAACLISGDTDVGVLREAQEAGLTLLQKPVRPAKLRSMMRHLIETRLA